MPRLHDDNVVPFERRERPPVTPAPGPHVYRLAFDDGTSEDIEADGPSEAVRARTNVLLPHTMSDLTEIDRWMTRRLAAYWKEA